MFRCPDILDRLCTISLCIVISTLFSSCSIAPQHIRVYPGKELPKDEVSYLVSNVSAMSFILYQKTSDGFVGGDRRYAGNVRLELLPASYKVDVTYDFSDIQPAAVEFDAEPAHTYKLHLSVCYRQDGDSGILSPHSCSISIRDVTDALLP